MKTSPTHVNLAISPHQCSVCFKSYKRREHLQRHRNSHSADRPHRCPACPSTFQRADVLRRHLRTCDRIISSAYQGATRKRACDRCARQKKACNGARPCQKCSKKGVECAYSTPKNDTQAIEEIASTSVPLGADSSNVAAASVDLWTPHTGDAERLDSTAFDTLACPDLDFLQYPDQTWQDLFSIGLEDPSLASADRNYFFHFLDAFTSRTGFVSSFECGTLEQRLDVLYTIEEKERLTDSFWTLNVDQSSNQDSNNSCGVSSQWLNDPLALQTHQILLLIKEVVMIKPRNSCVTISWSPDIEQRCLQFFSPTSLRKYIELYWSVWSPNVNFLHRPSFHPASSKPILLASMAIIGACVSPNLEDNDNARMWFNCVEEAVFADEDFNRDPVSPFHPVRDRQKMQALQAAYMVCLYQNWEGTDASKKRIRRHRFSTVVSTVRDLDIKTARHVDYNAKHRDEFDWNEFVAREELIRTFIWVFLLDTAFVTFNNLPPRMVVKEMKMHVAAPESCFQAPTADQCYDAIRTWMPSASLCWKFSFRALFETLCIDDLPLKMQQAVAALGPLNLFTIISGIHSLVFQYQSFFSAGHLLLRTHTALQNFKHIWHLHETTTIGQLPHTTVDESNLNTDNMWQRVGFCRHAGDFWLLASVKVDRLSVAEAEQHTAIRGEFVLEDSEQSDPILSQYDQTSMRQVNELISEFQRVYLGDMPTAVD
ncbi:C2H2 type zinc finger domain protein [Aspergillus udagawae]|uniref:C2H2 type zinc finger domain protein n=1 Tax=Aspergillus udagawae TaxID=91492 RepID=A0A8H3NRJ3_9EURO|nr:C2H2 type zinc finger domain protein [Aspergillus udagawae]